MMVRNAIRLKIASSRKTLSFVDKYEVVFTSADGLKRDFKATLSKAEFLQVTRADALYTKRFAKDGVYKIFKVFRNEN
jgi:hypothetical protein